MPVVSRSTRADGRRDHGVRGAAQELLAAAGIADQLGAVAVFTARTYPAHDLRGWVLADLAEDFDPLARRRVRMLIGVGSRAVYGFPLPRWGRAPAGPPFLLETAAARIDPPPHRRCSALVLHDRYSGRVIRLSGSRIRRTETRAALAAIRALTAGPATGHAPGPPP